MTGMTWVDDDDFDHEVGGAVLRGSVVPKNDRNAPSSRTIFVVVLLSLSLSSSSLSALDVVESLLSSSLWSLEV